MNKHGPLESKYQKDFKEGLVALGYEAYKHPPHPAGTPDIHAFKKGCSKKAKKLLKSLGEKHPNHKRFKKLLRKVGRHYWFEVKRSEADFKKWFKNKALQKLRRKVIREAGDVTCVVWKWKHILDALDGKKIPKDRL